MCRAGKIAGKLHLSLKSRRYSPMSLLGMSSGTWRRRSPPTVSPTLQRGTTSHRATSLRSYYSSFPARRRHCMPGPARWIGRTSHISPTGKSRGTHRSVTSRRSCCPTSRQGTQWCIADWPGLPAARYPPGMACKIVRCRSNRPCRRIACRMSTRLRMCLGSGRLRRR